MTNNAPESTTSPGSSAPRRKKRWWKVLVALIAVILLFVLFLPTLLSTAPGRSFLLSRVNKRIPVSLAADSLSLGWFSGASASNLQLSDPSGHPILRVETVNTPITVWNMLTGSTIDLGGVSITNSRLPQLPGSTLNVKLVGNADPSRKLVHITGESTISAIDKQSGQANTLTIAQGSTFSWGGGPSDLRATLTYSLDLLQKMIQGSLPEKTVLAGQRTIPLNITGTVAKGNPLAGISIASTSFGYDRIYASGADLGKADIPFRMDKGVLHITPTDVPVNGGTYRVQGRIDFTANPPVFIIDQPGPLVQNLALNKEIAAGPLRFIPLLWGADKEKLPQLAAVTGSFNMRIDSARIPLSAAARSTSAGAGSFEIANLTTQSPFFTELFDKLGPIVKIAQPEAFSIRSGKIPATPYSIANGRVAYQNLTLGTDKQNLKFSGSAGFDQTLDMSLSVTLKPGTISVLRSNTDIAIPVVLKGTIQKPQIAITPESINKSLQNVAPTLIEDLLKNLK